MKSLIAFLGGGLLMGLIASSSVLWAQGPNEGNLFLIAVGSTQTPDVSFLSGKLECEDLFPATGKAAIRDINGSSVSQLSFLLYSSIHCKVNAGGMGVQAVKNATDPDAFMGDCAQSHCNAIWVEPAGGTYLIY